MNRSKIIAFLCVILGIFSNTKAAQEFAQKLRDCHTVTQDRAGLNECLADVLRTLKPRLATGIPELNVPPLEPIDLGSFGFNQTSGQVRIFADFKDVLVRGFSKFILDFVDSDLDNHILTVGVYIPKLFVTGNYKLNGKVLALDINGSGPLRAILLRIDATMRSNIIIKQEAGGERLGITNTQIDFQLGDIKTKLANLFDDNAILGQAIELFVAENSQLILDEIRPAVARDLGNFVESVMDAAFANIPIDVVFSDRGTA